MPPSVRSAALLLALALVPAAASSGPRVAGWVETAWLGDPPVALPARLDTSIGTSILGAADIVLFDRIGSEWVRFAVGVRGGRETTLECPVVRMARDGEPPGPVTEHPVVRLRLCLAGKRAETEFILADGAGGDYPLRVGRAFLGGDVLVDPARTFTASGACARD
ncbi:MAG: RimK/LysX family protein [Hyphomicrobiales bacterium]